MKKGLIIGAVALAVILLIPDFAFAADAFAKAETKLQTTGISFQRTLKWVGVFAFLFGGAQWIVGRRQQGKFYMVSAGVGYALVLGVFLIFSLIESIFS